MSAVVVRKNLKAFGLIALSVLLGVLASELAHDRLIADGKERARTGAATPPAFHASRE